MLNSLFYNPEIIRGTAYIVKVYNLEGGDFKVYGLFSFNIILPLPPKKLKFARAPTIVNTIDWYLTKSQYFGCTVVRFYKKTEYFAVGQTTGCVWRRGHGWAGNRAGSKGTIDFGRFGGFSRSGHVELGCVTVGGCQLEYNRNVTHARVLLHHEQFTSRYLYYWFLGV